MRHPLLIMTHSEDARTILSVEYDRHVALAAIKHSAMFLGAKNIGLLHGREWNIHRSAFYRSMNAAILNESRKSSIEMTETLSSSLKNRLKEITIQGQMLIRNGN